MEARYLVTRVELGMIMALSRVGTKSARDDVQKLTQRILEKQEVTWSSDTIENDVKRLRNFLNNVKQMAA